MGSWVSRECIRVSLCKGNDVLPVTLLSPAVGGGPASLAHNQSMPALLELSTVRYGKQRFSVKNKAGPLPAYKVKLQGANGCSGFLSKLTKQQECQDSWHHYSRKATTGSNCNVLRHKRCAELLSRFPTTHASTGVPGLGTPGFVMRHRQATEVCFFLLSSHSDCILP